jgi:predicted nucleotidyltransferase
MVHYWPTSSEIQVKLAKEYPAEFLPYLKSHPPAGPVLTAYLWGGYLEWNARDLKTFVDSRVDIFEYAGVLKDYLDVLSLKQPDTILDKYKIRYVLLPPDEALVYVLQRDPKWKEIYSDKVCVLLERADAAAAAPAPLTQ